ncbi:cytochrome c [Pollutimonas sp. H1-120]|uniref:c-type cytochrome n=1 Tax=Pollutimonas sp. H1-120 TaxID=3148824 RepID=UPI003B52C948
MPSPIARRAAMLLGMIVLLLLTGCGEKRPPLSPRGQASQLGADVMRGRQLIADYGCVACHTIEGVKGPVSRVGPPLKDMALRAYVGGVLPNTPENLVRWLLDPPAVDPRTAMPDMGMSVADAKDIAAYLLTLH